MALKNATHNRIDRLLTTLGRYGRWQVLQTIIISLVWFHSSHAILSIVVIGYSPKHWCQAGNVSDAWNGSSTLEPRGDCELIETITNITHGCLHGHQYENSKHLSFVSEFDLVCDRDYLAQISQTLFMLGQTMGGYIVTFFSDKFGRKPGYYGSYLLALASGIGTSFAPDINWFMALRFINGLAQMGLCTVGFVLAMEMFPAEVSHNIGVLLGTFWAIGVCFVPLFGYLFQNTSWRYLQLTISIIALHCVFQFWFIDESVRWLYANGRDADAYLIIKKAARINKVDMKAVDECLTKESGDDSVMLRVINRDETKSQPALDDALEPLADDSECHRSTDANDCMVMDEDKHQSVVDILRHPKLRRHFLVCWILWPTHSLTYYGLMLMSNQLAGNRFVNLFLNGAVELPSKVLLIIALKRFGRKHILILSMVLCASFLITSAIITNLSGADSPAVTVLALLGKFAISLSFLAIWIYTPELYPTNLRSLGTGSASASARLAGMAAPFAGYLAMHVDWGPGAIFGGLCVVSSILILLLPETKGKPLAQTIPDIDGLYSQSRM